MKQRDLDRIFRFEYRHRRSRKCDARSWHSFCEAVNTLAVEYEMRTLARRKELRYIVAAELLNHEWWPADGEEEAIALGLKVERLFRGIKGN